jgi:hypothetical protein
MAGTSVQKLPTIQQSAFFISVIPIIPQAIISQNEANKFINQFYKCGQINSLCASRNVHINPTQHSCVLLPTKEKGRVTNKA